MVHSCNKLMISLFGSVEIKVEVKSIGNYREGQQKYWVGHFVLVLWISTKYWVGHGPPGPPLWATYGQPGPITCYIHTQYKTKPNLLYPLSGFVSLLYMLSLVSCACSQWRIQDFSLHAPPELTHLSNVWTVKFIVSESTCSPTP